MLLVLCITLQAISCANFLLKTLVFETETQEITKALGNFFFRFSEYFHSFLRGGRGDQVDDGIVKHIVCRCDDDAGRRRASAIWRSLESRHDCCFREPQIALGENRRYSLARSLF